MTSTSAKLLILSLLLLVPLAGANHNSGGLGGVEVDGTGLGVPEYDSTAEIVTMFAAPFIFIALLFRILFAVVFTQIVDPDNTQNYGTISTVMALSATAILVPTPFWDYVIYVSGLLSILPPALIAVTIALIIYRVYDFLN
jgi:uncharacterized membrane protein YjfL (UPF0719 family)